MKKQWLCLLLAAVLILMSAGCTSRQSQEPTVKVVFPEKFLRIAQMSPEAWAEDLEKTGEGQFVSAYVGEDGTAVTLELREEQRAFWLDTYAGLLRTLQEDFAELGEAYRVEYNDEGTRIDFYYDLELDAYDAIYYVMHMETFCICRQLLSGVGESEWLVTINIYNSATGKLVTSGDSDTGLSYETSDWEASY